MIVKLLTEHHFEFLSLKGGCTGSFESTLVKMPQYWKTHATVHLIKIANINLGIVYRTFSYLVKGNLVQIVSSPAFRQYGPQHTKRTE